MCSVLLCEVTFIQGSVSIASMRHEASLPRLHELTLELLSAKSQLDDDATKNSRRWILHLDILDAHPWQAEHFLDSPDRTLRPGRALSSLSSLAAFLKQTMSFLKKVGLKDQMFQRQPSLLLSTAPWHEALVVDQSEHAAFQLLVAIGRRLLERADALPAL